MTPKERVLNVLNRKWVDRTPVDLWYTPEVGAALRRHFSVETDLELYKAMDLDKIVWVFIDNPGITEGSADEEASGLWGLSLKEMKAGEALYQEVASAPMAGYDDPAQVDNFPPWPDPEKFDYDGAIAQAKAVSQDFAVLGPWVSFFEICCKLRGLEQAMMDPAINPELVDAILDRIESVQTEMMKTLFDRGAEYFDLAFVSDDMGGQKRLLFSPAAWDQHLRPRMERWCKLIHGYGLKVFYHTDGAAEPLIGPLIDCGIDVLNPIQHACPGMDPAELNQKYGDRVIFHGGVDNQQVLPFGTPDDVHAEVRYLLDTPRRGRRLHLLLVPQRAARRARGERLGNGRSHSEIVG